MGILRIRRNESAVHIYHESWQRRDTPFDSRSDPLLWPLDGRKHTGGVSAQRNLASRENYSGCYCRRQAHKKHRNGQMPVPVGQGKHSQWGEHWRKLQKMSRKCVLLTSESNSSCYHREYLNSHGDITTAHNMLAKNIIIRDGDPTPENPQFNKKSAPNEGWHTWGERYHDARNNTVIFSNRVPYRRQAYRTVAPENLRDQTRLTSVPKLMQLSQISSAFMVTGGLDEWCRIINNAPTAAMLQHAKALSSFSAPSRGTQSE
jgi:hypothetical protein